MPIIPISIDVHGVAVRISTRKSSRRDDIVRADGSQRGENGDAAAGKYEKTMTTIKKKKKPGVNAEAKGGG